ncbi:MAG: general secretion pathway protein GspK [Acidobacteria bacterium]|nr:general secretion pathway protein GspK [Acidobacteriota bacterium]
MIETIARSEQTRDCQARRGEAGAALLAVLWLTVALTFMAMATAQLVRTEVDAVRNQMDWQRSYYLARGGLEAAIYSMARYGINVNNEEPDVTQASEFAPGKRWLQYRYDEGEAAVEVVPESAKLNVNTAAPEELASLFASLGVEPVESTNLAVAIAEWRSPRMSEVGTPLDLYYANLPQPYVPRHAALDEVEELLPVRGMSRDLFFGHVERTTDGHWRKWPPLADLLTTEPTYGFINPNFASFEVLSSLAGWNAATAATVIAARTMAPFRTIEELQAIIPMLDPLTSSQRLTLVQGPIYTLTATGMTPNSGVRRSVRALVYVSANLPLYHRVLAWWDDWPSPSDLPQSPASNETYRGSSPS